MKVRILHESGYAEAKLGLSLSYNAMPETLDPLMRSLAFKQGGHNKFLESIIVWIDVSAPRYWWAQADTYRLSTKQSESTMHTLMRQPLEQENFEGGIDVFILKILNEAIKRKDFAWAKRHLPEGFIQRRVWCVSYKTLQNIISQRKTHKLPEWQFFIAEILAQCSCPDFLEQKKVDKALGREQADGGKYSHAIGQIECVLGIAGAKPLGETVRTVEALQARVKELEHIEVALLIAKEDLARAREALHLCLPFVSWPLVKHLAMHLEETACDEHEICGTVSDAMINEAERKARVALSEAKEGGEP